ncbi:ATPase, T2SS/T4P/T4SS family [Telmatospirillum siberiense]|uniref:ATPase n=1 Tax=Telmatospirillum siberiense TaxID=382514 RepID=A0A2N3PNH6_9PROT|nr:ATPase, T2SS/T4P/T4SS family [Telmatospirillum siberiense]PKU21946.1 ATPase [Telmatospirillum siberiense]
MPEAPAVPGDTAPQTLAYEAEPPVWNASAFDDFLLWAAANGVSDINLQTGEPIWLRHHGRMIAATGRPMSGPEMVSIISRLGRGLEADGVLQSGRPIDTAYDIQRRESGGKVRRCRFRVNASSCLVGGSDGRQFTLRTLPDRPPQLSALDPEEAIRESFCPRQGLVMVTGPTGSGKSTLLAAVLADMIGAPDSNRKVVTIEAPIEFVYDRVQRSAALVSQWEIPWHLPSFSAGVRNAMRCNPDIIEVGECRDTETMSACIDAANTGHAVYTTLHTIGVEASIQRILGLLEGGGGDAGGRAIAIMQVLRLIVTQLLLPTVDGRRCAVREFLVFSEEVRQSFLRRPLQDWPAIAADTLKSRGQPMAVAIERQWRAGRISADTFTGYAPDHARTLGITSEGSGDGVA